MAHQLFTNNGIALLSTNLPIGALSFSVPAGFGNLFPQTIDADDFFLVTLQELNLNDDPSQLTDYQPEIIKIESRTGDNFFIAPDGRGWEGTPEKNWTAGNTVVDHRITAGTLASFYANSNKSAPITTTENISIPPTTTNYIDVFETTPLNKSVKWVVTLLQQTTNKVYMYEIFSVFTNPSEPEYTIYGKVGDKIDHDVDVIGMGANMILQISNYEPDDVIVKIMRIQHY